MIPALWDAIHDIPDAELWAVRSALRNYLFSFIRQRARALWTNERVSAARVLAAGTLLDSDALDDRFRAAIHRLQAARPDLPGLRASRADPQHARDVPFRSCLPANRTRPTTRANTGSRASIATRWIPAFAGRVAFVEDYDLHVAHFLVQGCDVWLNNPRKPLEASGTSGMKASINGVPHFSIGDGWWAEGYNGANGWLIDGGGSGDEAAVDDADAVCDVQAAGRGDRAGVLRPGHRTGYRTAG